MITIGAAIGYIVAAFIVGGWFGMLISGLMVCASDKKKEKKK